MVTLLDEMDLFSYSFLLKSGKNLVRNFENP